jgi:hypothetical protein
LLAIGSSRDGMLKEGLSPKKCLPTKVAAPVAMDTGMRVRALTSGRISSMAKRSPPMGVLKVAAIPPPAPAETKV